MGILTKLFGGAEGCREAMCESYQKHVQLARAGKITFFDQSPHSLGLYGALGSRYRALGRPINEAIMWSELTPFLLMDQSDSVEALAEYALFQERPNEARTGWLKDRINLSFRSHHDESVIAATSIALMNEVAWCDLLEPAVLRLIEDQVR